MGPTEYFIPSQLKLVESASARRKMYHISNPRVVISHPNVFLSKTQTTPFPYTLFPPPASSLNHNTPNPNPRPAYPFGSPAQPQLGRIAIICPFVWSLRKCAGRWGWDYLVRGEFCREVG